MYRNILISTDGSELVMKGVEHGPGLAKEANAKVTVINVSHPYPLQSAATIDSWSAAETLGCDLIVMASNGRCGVSRLLLDSQTAGRASATVRFSV